MTIADSRVSRSFAAKLLIRDHPRKSEVRKSQGLKPKLLYIFSQA